MLNKIALVFALATALAGALPAFVGTALAQATVPQGECTTNTTVTARAEGVIQILLSTTSSACRKIRSRGSGFQTRPYTGGAGNLLPLPLAGSGMG